MRNCWREWNKLAYFKLEEFRCKCNRVNCDAKPINPLLVEKLDILRSRIGAPLIVSSGQRCQYWNDKSGGVKNSAHLNGDAADIRCIDSQSRWALIHANFATGPLFDRVGIGRLFVHVDVSSNHIANLKWLYK